MDNKYQDDYCKNCHFYLKHKTESNEYKYLCMCEPYRGVEVSKVDMCPKDMVFVSPEDLRKMFEETKEKTNAASKGTKPVIAIVGGEGSITKKAIRELLDTNNKDLLIDTNDNFKPIDLDHIFDRVIDKDDEEENDEKDKKDNLKE